MVWNKVGPVTAERSVFGHSLHLKHVRFAFQFKVGAFVFFIWLLS